MKKTAVALVLLSSIAWTHPSDAQSQDTAQSLDEVMSQYLEARGGLEKLRQVQTVRASGTAVMGGGVEFPFHYEWKRPNKFRFELVIQGTAEVQAFDGSDAWELSPNDSPEPTTMSDNDLALLNDAVDFVGPMVDAADKGHTLELVGMDEFEGTEVYKLKLTRESGLVEYPLLDSEYFLEIAQQEIYGTHGQEIVLETVWSDYKEVDGVLMPSTWQRRPQGGPPELTLVFEQLAVDQEIGDERFARPGGE